MAVKKKRTTSNKGKDKISAKSDSSVLRKVKRADVPVDDNETEVNENGLTDFSLLGDEEGDPDVNALAQEEELLEDDLDINNIEIATELSEDPVRLYLR